MFTYIHTLIISSISHKNFNLKISSIWSYCHSAFLNRLLTIQPGNIFEIFFLQKLSFLLRFNILMTLGLTLGFLGTFLPKVIKSWLSWPTSSQIYFKSWRRISFGYFVWSKCFMWPQSCKICLKLASIVVLWAKFASLVVFFLPFLKILQLAIVTYIKKNDAIALGRFKSSVTFLKRLQRWHRWQMWLILHLMRFGIVQF